MANWKLDFADAIIGGSNEHLVLLFRYGSRRETSDKDYFAVFNGVFSPVNFSLGEADFWAVDRNSFFRYLRLMDPFVTEPLLTGDLVCGDTDIKEKAEILLSSIKPTIGTIRYLLSRSFKAYIQAYEIGIEANECDPKMNRRYWSVLSYSIGYWCFAYQYKHNHPKITDLTEVVNSTPSQIRTLWKKTMDAKRTRLKPSLDLLSEWANFLLRRF